jgi:hypothetical protein
MVGQPTTYCVPPSIANKSTGNTAKPAESVSSPQLYAAYCSKAKGIEVWPSLVSLGALLPVGKPRLIMENRAVAPLTSGN